MLNRLIEWSLRNQLLVVVAVLLTVIGGLWSIRQTRVDAIPDLSDVQVILYTEYPGQAPQVISGVEEGTQVVTSAQFLLDSESTLQEAIQKMIAARRAGGTDTASDDTPADSSTAGMTDHSGH